MRPLRCLTRTVHACAIAFALLGAGRLAAAEAPNAAASAPAFSTTEKDVERALATVRSDPNLGGPRTERRLQFKPDDRKPQAEPAAPWLIELLRWMAEAGRGVVWLLGAIVVAVVIVLAWRWVRVRADAAAGRAAVLPPSHVNDLDIRPDSLPDDIAGTARALWERGEQRAALSLLYRGALSRLVHGHGVAITSASTEGECVQLAHAAWPGPAAAFFEQLVHAWETAVYAARWPEAERVAALFDGFERHFAATRAPETLSLRPAAGATA